MAIITPNRLNLRQLMEFASDGPALEFIDMLNEGEQKSGFEFFLQPGVFVYKTRIVTGSPRFLASTGIIGLRLDLVRDNPLQFSSDPANIIETFEIPFETNVGVKLES